MLNLKINKKQKKCIINSIKLKNKKEKSLLFIAKTIKFSIKNLIKIKKTP